MRCRKIGLIVVIGEVAAGKSTLSQALVSVLKGRHVNSIYAYLNTELPMIAELFKKIDPRNGYYLYISLLNFLVMIDSLLGILKALFWWLISKFCMVVVEEYLLGILFNHFYICKIDAHCSIKWTWKINWICLSMFKPDFLIYLHLESVETIHRRQTLRKDKRLESKRYLFVQSILLDYLFTLVQNSFNITAIKINTNVSSPDEVLRIVLDKCFGG